MISEATSCGRLYCADKIVPSGYRFALKVLVERLVRFWNRLYNHACLVSPNRIRTMLASSLHRSILRLRLRRVFHSTPMSQAQNITPARSDPPSFSATPLGSEPNPSSKSAGVSPGLQIIVSCQPRLIALYRKEGGQTIREGD